MAGSWIMFEHATPTKPEVFRLATLLNSDRHSIIGRLVILWIWADQQTTDGDAPSVTAEMIDEIAGRTGFADALLSVGWLERTDSGFRFPGVGETAKRRAQATRRKQRERTDLPPAEKAVTQMSRSQRDKNATREEKSTKEKIPPPPTPSALPAAPPGREEEEGFSDLVSELTGLGVDRAADALAEARSAGLTGFRIQEIIAHYRDHRDRSGWGPGALVQRLRNANPSLDAHRGWPAPSADRAQQQARDAERDREQQRAAQAAEEREAQELERAARLANLEARYGPIVDGWADDQIAELLAGNRLLARRFRQHGRQTLRPHLLLLAEKRDAQPVPVDPAPPAPPTPIQIRAETLPDPSRPAADDPAVPPAVPGANAADVDPPSAPRGNPRPSPPPITPEQARENAERVQDAQRKLAALFPPAGDQQPRTPIQTRAG